MRKFRELQVWQKAHQLTLEIYAITKSFPPDERFGLTSQLRRAGTSIPSNISEGCGRTTDKDFKRFLEIAISSGFEVEYQLLLARDLGYIKDPRYHSIAAQTVKVNKMLNRFINSLRTPKAQ